MKIVVILIAIYIFLILPGRQSGVKFPQKYYAHRGLFHAGFEENTLPAFAAAKQAGVGVELDVQYTKDKKIVVFHDESLKRMCGVDKKVSELTYAELTKLHVGQSSEKIPLFSEVLEVLETAPIICEIKMQDKITNTGICPEVLEMINGYSGFIAVESFDPVIMKWFRKNAPHLLRGQLAMDDMTKEKNVVNFFLKHLFVNALSRPQLIAYRYEDSSFELNLVKKTSKVLNAVWTVHGEEEIKKAAETADVVIFERE